MNKRMIAIACAMVVLFSFGCSPLSLGDRTAAEAMVLYKERRFEEAAVLLELSLSQRLKQFSESDVLTTIGNCYNQLDRFEESLAYHDRAILADPTNHSAYVNKGVVHRLLGEYDEAEALYAKALRIAPDYAQLHASMGVLAVYQEDYEAAINHLQRALELDDSLATAHSNLALALASVGRYEEAERELNEAIVRGYHQPDVIRKRIEDLRTSAREDSDD